MKSISITILQAIVVLIAIGAFAFLLIEPHFEGRNVNSSFFEVYFKDLFLLCAYAASTLLFIVLYKAFTLLGYARKSELYSHKSVRVLRTIRFCALALISLVLAAIGYLFVAVRGEDDITGGVMMGVLLSAMLSIGVALATIFKKRIQQSLL